MQVSAKRIMPPERPTERPTERLPARPTPGGPGTSNVVALSTASGPMSVSSDDDRVLLTRLARGDEASFRVLMRRHLSAVLATARRIVRDDAEAEDIVQEAFLRLWDQAANMDGHDYGLRPWLRRVASNLAIDWLRKAKRYDVTDEVPEQADPASQLQALEASDTAARLDQALSALSQRQRLAVSLFHFDQLSQRDVATAMQISEDALESLLARGRRKLKDLLKNDWRELLANPSDVK
jgi:RNA polymerase sigma-70 factor (ECF subfamily)